MSLRALALPLAAAAFATTGLAAVPSKEFARQLPLATTGSVSLESYKGTIRIRTWEKAEVSVKARIVADGDCGDEAEMVEKTDVSMTAAHGGVEIRADYDRLPTHWFGGCTSRPLVHFDVSLPAGAKVHVKDYKSVIDIAGLAGDLSLETYKGTGEVSGLTGGLTLETYKGELRVGTALRADTRVETYKGQVTLDLPKGALFTLKTDLERRATLDSDFAAASQKSGPLLAITSHKGEVRLRAR